MKWRGRSYWFKGGILAFPILILLLLINQFFANVLNIGGNLFFYLLPELFMGILGLGMRGTPPSSQETTITLIIVFGILILRIFIMGAIIGLVYGWFAKRNRRIIFFVLFILILVISFIFMSYRTQSSYNKYLSANSIEDCENNLNRAIENYSVPSCFKELAVKNRDVSICDRITTNLTDARLNDYKWFCYEEIAHITSNSAICAIIPTATKNESGVDTKRRNRCIEWFNNH